jgi:hypothetical protein
MLELPYWTAALLACASLFLPPSEGHLKFVFGLLAVAIDFYLLLFIFCEIGFHSISTPYIGKSPSLVPDQCQLTPIHRFSSFALSQFDVCPSI